MPLLAPFQTRVLDMCDQHPSTGVHPGKSEIGAMQGKKGGAGLTLKKKRGSSMRRSLYAGNVRASQPAKVLPCSMRSLDFRLAVQPTCTSGMQAAGCRLRVARLYYQSGVLVRGTASWGDTHAESVCPGRLRPLMSRLKSSSPPGA